MPMITIRYVTPAGRGVESAAVAAFASRLGAEALGKDPGVTAVVSVP